MANLTFYGGVDEIGGNKFLIEDKGTKVFLDFGMQMGKVNQLYSEFTQPRILNGMGDLFEFNLLPKLHGLYRKDYAKHMHFDDDHKNETDFDAVLLTHAHVDHGAYIHYLRPEIPIYCSESTKLIMQGLQGTGSREEYITFKENFKIYENSRGTLSRARSETTRESVERNIQIVQPYKKFNIDSIEVEALPVDHSIPGVYAYIIHTSKGTIGYTADLRFHGRRKADTEKFVQQCATSDIDLLLCEGTRAKSSSSITEYDVEKNVADMVNKTKNLVVVTYPIRDLDRLLSFYLAAKETGRKLAIDVKQAYLLQLFDKSETMHGEYPSLDDPVITIYNPQKSWGLIDEDIDYWSKKQILADYRGWERDFIDRDNSVDYRDIQNNQKDFMFYCSDFRLQELIDVRPKENSSYVRSSTEPFNDEMQLDHDKVRRWLVHFGLLQKDENWEVSHVSGHADAEDIQYVAKETNSKQLIPIHTENEDMFHKWHDNVTTVNLDGSFSL
jgi:ribonuclease J